MKALQEWLHNVRVRIFLLFTTRISMKEMFWKRLDYFLFSALLILSGLAYYLSTLLAEPTSSWFVNVSAGLFTSMFIIFGIDALHHSRIENKKRRGIDIARRDLQRLANMCISYFLFPTGTLSLDRDHLSTNVGPNWSAATNRLSLNKALQGNFALHVSRITYPEFQNLMRDLVMLGAEIKDCIIFYGDLMLPEVLGELLYVRQAYNDVSTKFAMFGPSLFTAEDHSTAHRLLGDAMLNYTAKVDDFTKELGNWSL